MFRSFVCLGEKKAAFVQVVRDMEIKDLDGVLEIEKKAFPTPWTRRMFLEELEEPLCVNRVAIAEEKVTGYSCFALVYDEVHLRNIAVHKRWRRRGIATRLLEDMFDLSIKQGAFLATLEVRKSSIHAQRLYERFGFRVAGVRPLYYSDTKEDALIMWADLRDRRTASTTEGTEKK